MKQDLCKKCGTCCKNIKADFSKKLLFWDGEQVLTEEFASMLTQNKDTPNVYTCKFLKDNLCTNNNKPDICKNYPKFPFTQLPECCDYIGEMFIQQEKIKQKIRKLKEEIIHYNALISTTKSKKEQNQLQKIIAMHHKQIQKYSNYGADNW